MAGEVRVYSKDGALRTVIEAGDGDIQNKSIIGVDVTPIEWSSPVPVSFEIGDYADILGSRYTLNQRVSRNKVFNRDFRYNFPFEGEAYKLARAEYLFLDSFNRYTKSYFFLNASPIDHLRLLVSNMNRLFPLDGWVIGNCLDGPIKNIQYDGINCLEAINIMTSKDQGWDTEFFVEGKKISLFRRQSSSGITMRFGPREAIHSITDEPQGNENPITRLYAYGSNKNLGSNYRLGEERLRLDGNRYVDLFTSEVSDIYEDTQIFEDIYPQRTGTITSITSPLIFTDSSMNFNVNSQLIPDTTAKVVFKSGLLSGYTFEITNYNNGTKTFTIAVNTDEQTVTVPSEFLYPQVGDQYTLVDIIMPESYVVEAEAQLRQVALKWLADNGTPKKKYTVVCNPFWFRLNAASLKLGEVVTIDVPDLEINLQIRVITINRNIRNPYIYAIELADVANNNILVNLITP